MAIQPTSTPTPASAKVPNKREKVAAQFGVIEEIASADWDSVAGDPATIKACVNRLAAAFADLLAKLDADAGVTDTDYASTLLP